MAAKKVVKKATAKKESPVKKAVAATAVKKTADKVKKPAASNAQIDKLKAENIALKARVKELEKILKDTVKNINKAL